MTTQLINGTYSGEINAFRSPALPSNPQPFLIALIDSIKQRGPDWLRSDEGRAILFPVLLMTYGPTFKLDSAREFERLDRSIPHS